MPNILKAFLVIILIDVLLTSQGDSQPIPGGELYQGLFNHPSDVTIEWDSVIQISSDTFAALVPQLLYTQGTVHIFWNDNMNGSGSIKYRRSVDGGKQFSSEQTLLENPPTYVLGNINRRLITASPNGQLHLIVDSVNSFSGYFETPRIFQSTTGGAVWERWHAITSRNCISHPYTITASDSSIWFLASLWDGDTTSQLLRSTDYGSTWDTIISTPTPDGGQEGLFASPGLLSLVDDAPDLEVSYSNSGDAGSTWSPPIYLSVQDNMPSDEPSIAGDTTGHIYVVWRETRFGVTCDSFNASIVLRRSTDYGASWETEQLISSSPTGVLPRVVTNGCRVAIFWNECSGNSAMRISTDCGFTWSGIIPINEKGSDPTVAMNDSIIYAAWWNCIDGLCLQPAVFFRRGVIQEVVGVSGEFTGLNKFTLTQNYPNPFNPETRIQYAVNSRQYVSLKIYDVLGREVATLVNEMQDAGYKSVTWDAKGVGSGVYFYRVRTKELTDTKKMLLIR